MISVINDTWKLFRMDDIFEFKKGKRLTKENMISGNLNYLGAISDNNAVRDHILETPHHMGNCITVNYNGSVGEAFYQSEPFWATDDINILDLKKRKMTENIGLFLCTVIKKNKYRFSYGRKWTLDKMRETYLLLPSKNDEPDYDFMERYIDGLMIKHVETKNGKKENKIDYKVWKNVKISDYFKVYRTENINFNDLNDNGKVPYVTRTQGNNGVEKFVDSEDYKLNKGNVIIIGGESAKAFYQSDPFLTGNNITVIENEKINKYSGLFISTLINKESFKYSYGRAFNTKNVMNTIIKLPFKNSEPDWQYMEDYIRQLPYADKI